MKVNLYSTRLKKASSLELPKEFSGPVNLPLVAQAIHIYRDRMHAGNSRVKTRGEVSLTTAKWYKQKGTGRARHGAKSAPIFVGGGVAHGPKGIKRVLTFPKKMKTKALAGALSMKAKEGKIVAVKDLADIKKTREAQTLINTIREGEKSTKGKVTFVVTEKNREILTFTRNIKDVSVERFSDLNAYKVYFGGKLVLDADIFKKK